MNRRARWAIASAFAFGSLTLFAWTARGLAQATGSLESARASFEQTIRDANTIVELRRRTQTVAIRERPPQDVIAQVNAILFEVGVASNHLRSLIPEGESSLPAGVGNRSHVRKQSVRLSLVELTPQELGAFLVCWQESQRIWNVDRLELVKSREKESHTRGSNQYDATLVMTAEYLASGFSTQGSPP